MQKALTILGGALAALIVREKKNNPEGVAKLQLELNTTATALGQYISGERETVVGQSVEQILGQK